MSQHTDPMPESPEMAVSVDFLKTLREAIDTLPEATTKTAQQAAEEGRREEFRRVCDPEFAQRIDRSRLANPQAFDRAAQWDGSFPGPILYGATGSSKTRAAWSALARLYVLRGVPFAWFPVRRLVAEMARYEEQGCQDEFFRRYSLHRVLFVDDCDKINWQFESQVSALFAFWDWVYRARRPVIATTNKGPKWWAERMGDAHARRMFQAAHSPVDFDQLAQLKAA